MQYIFSRCQTSGGPKQNFVRAPKLLPNPVTYSLRAVSLQYKKGGE